MRGQIHGGTNEKPGNYGRICETLSPLALQAGGEKTSHVLLHWLQHYCETIFEVNNSFKIEHSQ